MDCNFDTSVVCTVVQDLLCPDTMPALAMTYSPLQEWETVYEPEKALCRGTIFPGLDKPFLEGGCPR
ncbi:MAG: spore coat associated protein CotJA [Anaerotruncus sp.]|jgi:hypothetical protein|nr:spore coat associated protein CotJA [Anaerotruncus sp.]